jgi:REP element-mobilizing transposase RayT
MSYVRIWLHCVWATKNRVPLLTKEKKKLVIEHIKQNAKLKSIYIDSINGHTEHLHCIISLGPDQSIARVMQLIKGEPSFWINKNNIAGAPFEWADEYFAESASESQIQKVRSYISGQEEHHKRKSCEEKYNEFITSFGFERLQG